MSSDVSGNTESTARCRRSALGSGKCLHVGGGAHTFSESGGVRFQSRRLGSSDSALISPISVAVGIGGELAVLDYRNGDMREVSVL